MLSTPDVAGLITVLAALPVPFLISYVRDDAAKPGVVWFMLFMASSGAWALSWGLLTIIDDPAVTRMLLQIDLGVVSLTVISWFLFVLEFTKQTSISGKRVLPPLLIPVVLTQVLLWTNPSHHLVYTADTYVGQQGALYFDPGPWYTVKFGYDYLFPMMSLGMLVGEGLTNTGYRRRQSFLLIAGTLVPMAAGIVYALEAVPLYFNPTPISFLLVGGLMALALRRYRLLQVKPVPRHTTLSEIEEAVLTVSMDGTVLDVNPAAIGLFDIQGTEPTGRHVRETIGEFESLVETLANGDPVQTEISGTFEGSVRHLMVTSSLVKYGRGALCQAVVFRDITALKEREADLTTLKGLLSRVFRHNIRNELTKLIGRAELIRESDGDSDGHVGHILETCRKLQSHSDKARLAERVIDEEGLRVEQSLETVLDRAVADIAEQYPDATVEVSMAESVSVLANPHLGAALYNVIENAIVHGSDPAPTVSVTIRTASESAVIEVTDSGPGIPDREVAALQGQAETALDHGSGVGLWLVDLVVEKSRGDLEIIGGPEGTTVRIRLRRVSSTSETTGNGQRREPVTESRHRATDDVDRDRDDEQTRLPTD